MSNFRFPPPDKAGWWRGRPYDNAEAEPEWYDVHKDRFDALVVTIKGKDGAPQEVPVQVVPCVWAGPFPREDVS